jgi:hypothetical protein
MPRWEWKIFATLQIMAGAATANLFRLDQGHAALTMLACYLFFLAISLIKPAEPVMVGRHRKE